MSDSCPHCGNLFERFRLNIPEGVYIDFNDRDSMSYRIDWYDEHNMHADEQDIYCPLCRNCQSKVYRDHAPICTCRYCLGEQRKWAKEAYDASPEGIAEAEEKRKVAAAEAEEKRKRDSENARKERDAELLRYSKMREERDAELSRRSPKKGNGNKYESKPKGKNKRR